MANLRWATLGVSGPRRVVSASVVAARSQYALEPGLLPISMMERLLGTERFVVTDPGR
jgi:hypothetical protein